MISFAQLPLSDGTIDFSRPNPAPDGDSHNRQTACSGNGAQQGSGWKSSNRKWVVLIPYLIRVHPLNLHWWEMFFTHYFVQEGTMGAFI